MMMNSMMRPMNPPPYPPVPPAPWLPPLPPLTSSFWDTVNLQSSLKELRNTVSLAEAMEKELVMLIAKKDGKVPEEGTEKGENESLTRFSEFLENNRIGLDSQEMVSVEEANALMSKLRTELEPFKVIIDDKTPWEKSAAVRLANEMQKHKRNKLWRKRKRQRIAKKLAKHEQFDQADHEADEWRAREIAKENGKRKVEKMKEIAKQKS